MHPEKDKPIIATPPGMIWFGDVKVAGTQYEGRKDIIRNLAREGVADEGWTLVPRRELDNKYDENAIAVIATKENQQLHLGYLPKQVAASLADYKSVGLVIRSISKDGGYLYVDVFHSLEKCWWSGCLSLILISFIPLTAFITYITSN